MWLNWRWMTGKNGLLFLVASLHLLYHFHFSFFFSFFMLLFCFYFLSWYQFIFVWFNSLKFYFTYFSRNYDNYSMFRDVPECSMFLVLSTAQLKLHKIDLMRKLVYGLMSDTWRHSVNEMSFQPEQWRTHLWVLVKSQSHGVFFLTINENGSAYVS